MNVWPDEREHKGRFSSLGSWRWAWLGGGLALVAACSAVFVPLRTGEAGVVTTAGPAPAAPWLRGDITPPLTQDEPVAGTPFVRIPGDGAEGRLMAAYAALGEGRGREAFEMAAWLVHDHPNFPLAQLLYADLLAAHAGWPAAFGVDAAASSDTQDPRRLGLRLEAQRRIAALRERPPAGRVPAEFVRLAPSIKYAIAVDAARSRLYLFAHGPEGLSLERDFYVSLGKQGVDKFVEGDRRTPLGVYWITAALPKQQLDPRFGNGALRFNYPNAADKMQGRTGSGLFLHGVPSEVMNHEPWATDGCVAMANSDVEQLLQALDVSATPVVITRAIRWVAPEAVRQAAAEFEPAWQAWSQDRRDADGQDAARWYLPGAPEVRRWKPEPGERRQLSLLSWQAEGAPMMVVTSHAQEQSTPSAVTYRQYWTRQDNRWRISFEGSVGVPLDATGRQLASAEAAKSAEPATAAPADTRTARREAKAKPAATRAARAKGEGRQAPATPAENDSSGG